MACQFPFLVTKAVQVDGFSSIPVPCGKCYDCKMRIVSQWAFRLQQEEKQSLSSLFVTLTYNTETIPISPKGFLTLDKTDVQKFMKRLRKHSQNQNIKYFAVGEYGTKKMRPHYHILLFNTDQETILKAWNLGEIHIGNITEASTAYTLKYMLKEPQIPKHKNDDRKKEFRLMSKGLGKNYLTPNIIKYHTNRPNENYVTIEQYKIPMPRYYRNKLYAPEIEIEHLILGKIKIKNPIILEQNYHLKKIIQKQNLEKEKNLSKITHIQNLTDYEQHKAEYRTKRATERAKNRKEG